MTIYFTTDSDGLDIRGIGELVQYQLFCYGLSRLYNVSYAFDGFKNLTHYQYFNMTQKEFDADVNRFFNFKTDKQGLTYNELIKVDSLQALESQLKSTSSNKELIIELTPRLVMEQGQAKLEEMWNKKILISLGENLQLQNQTKISSNEKKIAIHIRKYTKTDFDGGPAIRDLFSKEKEQYYLNLVESISDELHDKEIEIHIFSQGTENEFEFLHTANLRNKNHYIIFHIEEYPIKSLEFMFKSEILVMANSSFGYILHLMRDKPTYVKQSFYHKTYKTTTKYINYDGTI